MGEWCSVGRERTPGRVGAWQVTWRCGRSGDDSLLTEHLLGARCPITDEMGAMPAHFTGEETEAQRSEGRAKKWLSWALHTGLPPLPAIVLLERVAG